MRLENLFNKIYNKVFSLKYNISVSTLSPVLMLFMRIRGIQISGCKFYGKACFLRGKNTTFIVGKNCTFRSIQESNQIGINHKCIFTTQHEGAKLTIGEKCGFSGTTIGCFKEIRIGKNVRCGANTLITDSDWHLNDPRSGEPKPIVISDNVWLGYGVVVMKGVKIGENTVIGLNSVVVKDIPANCIAAGNPCKVIKSF